MRYIVNTDEPFWGDRQEPRNDGSAEFRRGDLVEVLSPTPDEDGDVVATNLSRRSAGIENDDRYLSLSCLTPEDEADAITPAGVTLDALRGALAALGIEADVVAVALAIDAARAKGARA